MNLSDKSKTTSLPCSTFSLQSNHSTQPSIDDLMNENVINNDISTYLQSTSSHFVTQFMIEMIQTC